MNAYAKLFTTNPPIITKTIPPRPIYDLLMAGFLIIIAICLVMLFVLAKKEKHKAKKLIDKVLTLVEQSFSLILSVISILLAGYLIFNCNKPTHAKVIASNAPRIEKKAIRSVHKKYPYLLTITSNDNDDKNYLLKNKPHKGTVDLYKLRFDKDNSGNLKPYIKHVGYRSLPINQRFSISNSTSYFHNKVSSKQGCNAWDKPGTLSALPGQKPSSIII